MQLLRNVLGAWNPQKQNSLFQDLDTIQRNVSDLQQLLATLTAQVNAIAATPAATISADNHVTTYGAASLTSVAVASTGALKGSGTITDPLAVSVDNATVIIASNQLTAQISVAAAGALTGNGSVATPLSVQVDGSTITINGSNQLVATTGDYTLHTKTTALTNTNLQSLNSTPVVHIAGVTGKIIIPLITVVTRVTGASPNNVSSTGNLYYANDTANSVSGTFPTASNSGNTTSYGQSPYSNHAASANNATGQSIKIKASSDVTGGDANNTTTLISAYILM